MNKTAITTLAFPTAELVTKYFQSRPKNFDHVFSKVHVSHLGNGKCVAELLIEKQHTNPMGTLQTGYSVDALSSIGLSSLDKVKVPHVSVNINIRNLKDSKVGQTILIEANTVRCGKTLAFLEVLLKDKETGDVLIKGEHTKYFLQKK